MGEGKALPGFPVCKFRGKSIPGFMCMSPKISISSTILTEALKYLDQLNFFERHQDGPTPFGLLDVHGSRLQLPFLEYINNTTPDGLIKWIQTLINPNATDFWRVGDSSNHRGFWKVVMTVEKDALIQFKHRHEFEITDFDWCNILLLINRVWNKLFARRDRNLEAIIYRGCFYLERGLLKDLVIMKKSLDDEQLKNQHDPPLQTNLPIPSIISTGNFTISS